MPKSVPFCDVNDTFHSINSLCISMTVRAYVVDYITSTFCRSSYFAIDQSLLFTWKILIYFQPIESSVNKHQQNCQLWVYSLLSSENSTFCYRKRYPNQPHTHTHTHKHTHTHTHTQVAGLLSFELPRGTV